MSAPNDKLIGRFMKTWNEFEQIGKELGAENPGSYIQKLTQWKVIDREERQKLHEVVKLRNQVAHSELDQVSSDEVKEALKRMQHAIDLGKEEQKKRARAARKKKRSKVLRAIMFIILGGGVIGIGYYLLMFFMAS